MGMAGIGNTKFAREIFASPHPALNITGVDDKDLSIFIRDSLFNFMLKQALKWLEDPSALAKVTRLHALAMHIPVYSELARVVQELSDAMHKFQKDFNDRTGQMVIQLKATKRHMEEAQIWS